MGATPGLPGDRLGPAVTGATVGPAVVGSALGLPGMTVGPAVVGNSLVGAIPEIGFLPSRKLASFHRIPVDCNVESRCPMPNAEFWSQNPTAIVALVRLLHSDHIFASEPKIERK